MAITDETGEETIAFVVRGRKKSLQSYVKNCPLDLKIVEIYHYDEGIVILSMEEVDGLRAGNYSAVHMCTRKRMRKRRWDKTPTEPEAVKSEPTETEAEGQEGEP